jgi:hypothetical protein
MSYKLRGCEHDSTNLRNKKLNNTLSSLRHSLHTCYARLCDVSSFHKRKARFCEKKFKYSKKDEQSLPSF